MQVNEDLATKAIRGELGWETTAHCNLDHINASLFYVAQVVDMLSCILDVPLRYELRLRGSYTSVCDRAPPTPALSSSSTPSKARCPVLCFGVIDPKRCVYGTVYELCLHAGVGLGVRLNVGCPCMYPQTMHVCNK